MTNSISSGEMGDVYFSCHSWPSHAFSCQGVLHRVHGPRGQGLIGTLGSLVDVEWLQARRSRIRGHVCLGLEAMRSEADCLV